VECEHLRERKTVGSQMTISGWLILARLFANYYFYNITFLAMQYNCYKYLYVTQVKYNPRCFRIDSYYHCHFDNKTLNKTC